MSTAREDAIERTSSRDVTDWWSTAISDIEPGVIRFRGYPPVEQLIGNIGFAEMIWLMVRGRAPPRRWSGRAAREGTRGRCGSWAAGAVDRRRTNGRDLWCGHARSNVHRRRAAR